MKIVKLHLKSSMFHDSTIAFLIEINYGNSKIYTNTLLHAPHIYENHIQRFQCLITWTLTLFNFQFHYLKFDAYTHIYVLQ